MDGSTLGRGTCSRDPACYPYSKTGNIFQRFKMLILPL